jgi:adenosylhomocysteine nucleosidase
MPKLGIVTGLAFEAELLTRQPTSDVLVRCAGLAPSAALLTAQALVQDGATALMSFGIAGGLDPRLSAGAVIITNEVRAQYLPTLTFDGRWAEQMRRFVPNALNVPLAHTPGVLNTPAAKADLFEATGAAAADMESYGVAEVAAAQKIPFAALRVVADGANDSVPTVAMAAMTADGRVRVFASVMGALMNPGEIPELMALGSRTAIAKEKLRELANLGVTRGVFV